MKNKIESIVIEHLADHDYYADDLGTFIDDPTAWAIIRKGEHTGKFCQDLGENDELPAKGRTFRLFLPLVENYAGLSDAEIRQYCLQDWQRMESNERGEWSYLGIRARANIVSSNGVRQFITSAGLRGVESDSGADYLESVAKDELLNLRLELDALSAGFEGMDEAFAAVETVNR